MNIQTAGTMTVTSRAEAAMCGLSRFYTGKVCRAGHLAERFISNRQCVACNVETARLREAARARSDPSYRMYRNAQRRAGQALRGAASPVGAIACTAPDLRAFIEGRFRPGMSWAKYGQWEVDHVRPLSAARSTDELIALCHYTNLQPLWKRENLMKGGA